MHWSFYDSICPYQPKDVEGCSKPVDHLLVSRNSGETSPRTGCVEKYSAKWIYFRTFFFNLWRRLGNNGENLLFYCLGSCLYARYMANIFLALTAIHTTLAANGKLGLKLQRFLLVRVPKNGIYIVFCKRGWSCQKQRIHVR